MKSTGQAVTEAFVTAIGPCLTHLQPTDRAPRIRFAMQLLYGTAVNAVLNDPGPLLLDDPRLERELARVVCQYLGLPAPAAGTRKSTASASRPAPGTTVHDTSDDPA